MISSDVANTLDFPSPLFHLGQTVDCKWKAQGKTQKRQGVVIGLQYISIQYALIDQTGQCGWIYTISTMVGKSDTAWLKVRDLYDVQWSCIETEMHAAAAIPCEKSRTHDHLLEQKEKSDLIPAGKVA